MDEELKKQVDSAFSPMDELMFTQAQINKSFDALLKVSSMSVSNGVDAWARICNCGKHLIVSGQISIELLKDYDVEIKLIKRED